MNKKDIQQFIKKSIISRDKSLFYNDIENNKTKLINNIKNKSVLVIGGAGTIGSSFIKEILKFKPNKLVVVDTNENGLTELTRDLRSQYGQYIPKSYYSYPMNFGDKVFIKMFSNHGPFNIVANFAAHKHVRSEKDIYSIEAMIDNNVLKAKRFLDLLVKSKPDHFFCVSTDKAANPVNIMGVSKKIMEEVIMSYSKDIKISTARFANVAFSNGSLLDGFIERINKNQPISCPNDVKRFFVSPEESGQICMLSCILGNSSDIFFPKLKIDELVNFKDIADRFFKFIDKKIVLCNSENEAKKLSNNSKGDDRFPVYYFKSDTSGEKLYEEFFTNKDTLDLDSYNSLGVIKNTDIKSNDYITNLISDLEKLFNSRTYNKKSLIILLKKYVKDFEHIETGKNLDQKM